MADLPNTIALDDDDDDDFDTRDNCTDSSASASNNCAIAYLLRISLRDGQTLTEFPLLKPTTTIGRKKSNDIILMDQTVSSEHAEVEVEPQQRKAFVVDLNSTNKTRTGTQLPSVVHQNKKIKANRECILESGHYVTFGDVHFRFFHAHDYQNRDLQPDAEHQTVDNSGNANVLPETQSFDEDDDVDVGAGTVTNANTQLNRTNRSQIDLKLSVSDDENGAGANRESPRKVQFEGVSQSQQSERSVRLAPTLEWNDDDDDDTQKSVALAQTVAYDDDVDADQEENGEEEDADVVNLPATVACPDEDEDETQEDTLPATMAVEEDASEADDAQQSSHQQLLAATLAVEEEDGNEDGDELAPTLALCDDNEEEEERPVLAATMAVDDTEALPATIAMDENAEETTDDADVLPATVAMDDNETDDDDGDAVMNENRDEDCLPATVAMGEINDEDADGEEQPRECEEELPATVAMPDDDDDDEEEEDETQEPEQQPQQHALPATVAFEDEDADVDNLAATLAVLSDTDNDADADERALPATLAVVEEQVAHQAQNAQYLLQSEKQPLVMTDDDEQQNQQQEIDSKPSMVAQTERIDTEDVDLDSASMSSRSLTNHNHGNDKNDNKDDHVNDTGNDSDVAQSAAEVVDANVVPVANQDSSKIDESECAIKKKITQDDDDEDYVVEEEEAAEAAEEEDDDEDGDVSMGDNRPLLKSLRASGGLKSTGNQKETPRQRAAQKKKSVPSSSLLSLFAMRGRGRKRNVNQRDEEDSDKEREEKADETQDAETRIQAPPAKRARRGRRSSKSGQSESESESDASKSKRRPTKQRLPSPNKRNRSNTSVRRSKRLSSMPAAHTESDSDAAGAGGATGKRVVLLRTGTNNPKERQRLQEMGAVVLDEYDESVTHIVSSQPRRTLKFICGLATAKHIVTDAWPSQCVKKQTLEVDEQRYFPSNKATKTVEKQYGFSLKKSFQSLQQRAVALFDGYKVYFTKDFPTNQKKGIAPMAQAHGAAVMSRLPRATRSGQIDDDVIVIGFSADDSKDHDTLIKKGYDVYNKEIIITSILRQEINFDDESFVLQ